MAGLAAGSTRSSNHDGLGDFYAGSNYQQPAEEQHRDDGSRDRPSDGGNAQDHQPDPERQEPSSILDDFVRNLDFKTLDVTHRRISCAWLGR